MTLRGWMLCCLLGSSVILPGCFGPKGSPETDVRYADLQSEDPIVQIEMLKRVAQNREFEATPYVIRCLYAEDAPLRGWANMTLKRIKYGPIYDDKGQLQIVKDPFGYDAFSTDVAARNKAAKLWKAWFEAERERRETEAAAEAKESAKDSSDA